MKKLISLLLILCMACMLIPAMAEESPAGVWYADYSGAVMILTLGEDGSASMEVSGTQMGSGTWAIVDGKIEITMTDMSGEPSTQVATLADGVLTMGDDTMTVDFTREPIEVWAPAEVKADILVIATVSNWGAYGIVAALEQLTRLPLLLSFSKAERFLRRTVSMGSVDGISHEHVVRVDGFGMEIEKEILDGLHEYNSVRLHALAS